MNSGTFGGMDEQPPLPGKTQLGDTRASAFDAWLKGSYQPGERAMFAAALLVAMVPTRVLDRPDARSNTLVPRWTVELLRSTVEECSPGMIEELKDIARKAGQNV